MHYLRRDHREVRSVHRLSWRVGQTRRFVLAGCCCSSQAGKDRAPPGEAGRGPWSCGLEPAEGRLHPCGRRSLAREAGLPTRCSCLLSRRHLRHASPAWPPPVFRRDGGGSRCSRARGAVRPALVPTGLLSSGCSSALRVGRAGFLPESAASPLTDAQAAIHGDRSVPGGEASPLAGRARAWSDAAAGLWDDPPASLRRRGRRRCRGPVSSPYGRTVTGARSGLGDGLI